MKKFLILIGLLSFITFCTEAQKYIREVSTAKYKVNETVDSTYTVMELGGYNNFSLDINTSGGVTTKAFATLDESLSNTDTTGWKNVTYTFFVADSVTDSHEVVWTTTFVPVKIMLYHEYSDDSNSTKVMLAKWR